MYVLRTKLTPLGFPLYYLTHFLSKRLFVTQDFIPYCTISLKIVKKRRIYLKQSLNYSYAESRMRNSRELEYYAVFKGA